MAAESTFKLEFPYRRSVGPVIGAFLTGLVDGRILGIRTAAGNVVCPPLEYDPETGEGLTAEALVEVADAGVVVHAAFVVEPMRKHPLDTAFSWALIKLDGADSALLHAVDGDVAAGARVKARWRDERKGHITDIECFEAV